MLLISLESCEFRLFNYILIFDIAVEANEYLPPNMPGHGYDGYVNTTISDPSFMKEDSDLQKLTSQLIAHTGGDAGRDVNAPDPNRDQATGVFGMASHADRNGKRAGTNTLLKRTLADPAKFKLSIQLETLVTRIIINWEDGKPSATGVEVLRGSHQYEVSNEESLRLRSGLFWRRAQSFLLTSESICLLT